MLCVPEVPLVGLATRGQHKEQRPYGGFGEPAAVNIRFEPCQLLRQILAMLGRLAGTGSRRCIVVQALSSHGLHQRQAVQRVKRLCVDLVAAITELIQHLFDGGGKLRLQLQERVGLGDGLTMVAHVLRSLMYCGGERMPVRPQFIAHAQRMQLLQPLRTLVRDQGTHPWLHEAAVASQVDLGDPRNGGEPAIVLRVGTDDLTDFIDAAAANPRQEDVTGWVSFLHWVGMLIDLHVVNACRQHVDDVDVLSELLVLFTPDAAGDEDSQMSDAVMGSVDDGLVMSQHVQVVAVQVGDPAQGLGRWRDVVPIGAEHQDRRANIAQVDAHAIGCHQLGGAQLVADEQVIDDVLYFHIVQEDVAAPVLFELQVARAFRVDIGVQVVLFAPKRIGRVQVFKVLYQPGTVEPAGAQIAGQCRQPTTAGQAACIAHRHVARPVRQRRAGDDDRSEQFGPDGSCHQDLPARLAIADDSGLAAAAGVQLADLAHEGRFGAHDVLDGLAGNGIGQKANEVAGMTSLEGRADLTIGFEAANAWAVARAGIDHHERPLLGIGRRVGWRQDAYEAIVDRLRKVQPGHDDLGGEVEYVRRLLLQMLLVLVAALAANVGIQNGPLPGIHCILGCHRR